MCIRDSSVRGVEVFERLSRDMRLHLMDVAPPARSVIHSVRTVGEGADAVLVYYLAGRIGFTGAERVVSRLTEHPPEEHRLALDLTGVHSVSDVARRMILESARRLRLDGHEVLLSDSEEVMPDADPGDGEPLRRVPGL